MLSRCWARGGTKDKDEREDSKKITYEVENGSNEQIMEEKPVKENEEEEADDVPDIQDEELDIPDDDFFNENQNQDAQEISADTDNDTEEELENQDEVVDNFFIKPDKLKMAKKAQRKMQKKLAMLKK
jgi:hypothetical protein